jgi:iron complex outermembrane receptor protein
LTVTLQKIIISETITGELRAQSSHGHEIFDGSTAWTAGIFVKQEQQDLLRQYTYLDSDFTSTFDTRTTAIFAQLDSQITSQVSLSSGLRVEKRQADYQNSDSLAFEPGDTMVGGKLVLSYQYSDDKLLYASLNRGFKAGGANTHGSLTPELREFDPEYLVNYELGYKVSLLDNQAYLRAAIFYMDRKDVQVKDNRLVKHVDNSTGFISFIDNAAKGSNHGLELEGGWQINSTIDVYGALGLLQTRFSGLIDEQGQLLAPRDQAHAPSYQFNLGVNYQPNDNWLINLGVDGKDKYYFSDSHDQQSTAVKLVNASLTYLADHWQIKIWARNVLDKDYANRGFYFPNDPRDGYLTHAYHQLAEPRVFGATLDYQF